MASQHNEDELLLFFIDRGMLPRIGRYVDVGAWDPVDGSNTYGLYQLGWRGIAIDPQIELADKWAAIRPRDLFLPLACSDGPRRATLWMPQWSPLSSLSKEWNELHGRDQRSCEVPCVTVNSIVHDSDFDFLSIDVEGHELAVLDGALPLQARVICLENVEPVKQASVASLMKDQSYEVLCVAECNTFYKKVH